MHGANNTCPNACILSEKMHMHPLCSPMQRRRNFLAMEAIANFFGVLCQHHAGCSLPPALLLARQNQSPDAVRSRNLSKSTLAHDAVAAAVSHKHHLIIRVGASSLFMGRTPSVATGLTPPCHLPHLSYLSDKT